VADGHVKAAAQAPVGARYLLAESFQSLTDIARAVAAAEPRAKVPRVMPLPVARGVSTVGERVAQLTGRPPMIPQSVLRFLERGSKPSGARARSELGWEPTPFATGVERTLAHFRRQGWL
jgi:dihydroflavonol-4-reductase